MMKPKNEKKIVSHQRKLFKKPKMLSFSYAITLLPVLRVFNDNDNNNLFHKTIATPMEIPEQMLELCAQFVWAHKSELFSIQSL